MFLSTSYMNYFVAEMLHILQVRGNWRVSLYKSMSIRIVFFLPQHQQYKSS